MVVHACNPRNQEVEVKQEDHEFRSSLGYIVTTEKMFSCHLSPAP